MGKEKIDTEKNNNTRISCLGMIFLPFKLSCWEITVGLFAVHKGETYVWLEIMRVM